ncbi:carbohydrate ABC transporter permease [Pseudoruegeria sp. HB172150]|uniref:carbohydrate ABC transporter permease n=1 Tax=Pseudoruegeria sp. HB172150 TaxID=2721164 RepID=UPI001555BE0B|nr:carbohydrate ABC transporter permease [Pseudoruegeria sp. HB172150]
MKADRRTFWMVHAVLVLAAVLSVFPLFWMTTTAFTPNELVLRKTFRFWPDEPSLANFRTAFAGYPVAAWLWNSILIATLVTVGKLAIAVPAGFAFAHLRFRGREAAFWTIVATMTFPTIIGIVPLYVGISMVGWFDTRAGVIVPSIAYIGFYVFFMRQSFRTLPREMFEAARMDAAGPFRQLLQIAIPNVLPSIASLSVISFMGAWNIYLWALLVLDSPEKRTLAVGLKAFTSIDDHQPMWGPMMAVALLSALPVLLIFAFAQRFVMAAFTGRVGE